MDRKEQKSPKDVKTSRPTAGDTKNLSELMEFDFDDILTDGDTKKTAVHKPAAKAKDSRKKWLRYLPSIKEAVLIVLVLWLIIHFIGTVNRVGNHSMEPLITEGQSVIVSKVVYRLKEPSRDDLICYEKSGEGKLFGRIIGMPGDEILIESNGNISINGTRYQGGRTVYLSGQNTYPLTLEDGCYFVLCENAREGKDSRYREIGTVRRDEIQGKILCRIWPVSAWGVVE